MPCGETPFELNVGASVAEGWSNHDEYSEYGLGLCEIGSLEKASVINITTDPTVIKDASVMPFLNPKVKRGIRAHVGHDYFSEL